MRSRIRGGTVIAVLVTAVITAFLTSIVKDVIDLVAPDSMTEKITAVSRLLKDYCIYDVDEETMNDYALIGIAASTGDPYTSYYPKDEFSSYKDNVSSSYVGIGATLGADIEKNQILVISPMEDSPAEAAGLKSGDVIKEVDGVSYGASQLSEAAAYLKNGDKGTTVTLKLDRDGEEKEITITRDEIIKISVKSKMLAGNKAYVRITSFDIGSGSDGKSTYDEFCEHLDSLKTAGMTGLIIDLRDNPGGDFDSVCKIADELLPEALITYTEDKAGKRNDVKSDAESVDVPMVVLIDGGSASASEAVRCSRRHRRRR